MGVTFNADEVLGLAVEIERNGRAFYLRAAGIVKDAGAKKLLSDLADWEKGHQDLFERMRSELSGEERTAAAFDPEGEGELYLRAMADAHVFKVSEGPASPPPARPQALRRGEGPAGASLPSDGDTAAEILTKALGFERDSILFFLGLKAMVPERLGTDRVENLIREEMGHVAQLKRRLGEL